MNPDVGGAVPPPRLRRGCAGLEAGVPRPTRRVVEPECERFASPPGWVFHGFHNAVFHSGVEMWKTWAPGSPARNGWRARVSAEHTSGLDR